MPQPSTPESVDAVAREAFNAYEAKEWAHFARLVHPRALADFRQSQLQLATMWEARPLLSRLRDAEMPEAVAQYFERSDTSAFAQNLNPALMFLPGVESATALGQLSAEELYARWLEGRDPRPEQYDDGRAPKRSRVLLGHVTETDSIAHVVYRVRTELGRYGENQSTYVVSFERTPDGWRLLPNDDFGSGEGIRVIGISPEGGQK